ncbi:MAG: UDP-N-acetylmuramate dehydrogenase [Christensenellaceae bacterium]|jgi:UDP-N-acetylmuramate dehydrogenase|nr:UDP-N-acetylmuramate dehydrogenase [Christensenellaceae bacterium]
MLDQVLKSYLEHICGKTNVRENVHLKTCTTFKIGGPARFFVKATTKTMLVKLISALNFIEYPYRVIGAGSNLLASDKGYDGVIIRLDFKEIIENQNFIYADAGASFTSIVKKAEEWELGGLEWAYGIPGTIGGAIFGNAGAFGSCISDVVPIVDVLLNGEIVSMDTVACKFKYRESLFQRNRKYTILGAYFALERRDGDKIRALQQQYITKRTQTQPSGPSAGSVFRNPPGNSAGAIIDKLGFRDTQIGGAVVSPKHANFIINEGGATAKDVTRLINKIKKRVKDAYGISLKTEIETI